MRAEPNSRDVLIRRADGFLVWLLYREVTVYRDHGIEVGSAPQVTVANHFGGFADPLLLLSVMRRRPRIIARDRIWKVPLLWCVGGVPVRRPEDMGANRNGFGPARARSSARVLSPAGRLSAAPHDGRSEGPFQAGCRRRINSLDRAGQVAVGKLGERD